MNHMFYGTASITTSPRSNIQIPSSVPGPGTYNPSLPETCQSHSIQKWTLKPKIDHGSCFENTSITPAPDYYNVPLAFEKNLSDKKGKNSKSVDPHHKEYKIDKYKTFGEKSSPMSLLNMPSSISTKSGFVFGFRDQVIVREKSPGPIYDIHKSSVEQRTSKKKNTCSGFGFGNRNGIYKKSDDNPGPGAYHPSSESNESKSSHWTFPKDPKTNMERASLDRDSIGPGEYNPKMPQNIKSCKIKGKYPDPKRDVFSTGPGTYDLPDTKSKLGARFNTTTNKGFALEKNDNPSPFSYSPKRYPDMIAEDSGFSIAGDFGCADQKENFMPGPGSYELRQDLTKKQEGGYIGQKIKQKKMIISSNFYKYTPNQNAVSRQSPKFSFSSSIFDRCQNRDIEGDNLGPGSYKIDLKTGETHAFGKDGRWKQAEPQPFYSKNTDAMYSTIGYLPGYLKRSFQKENLNEKTNGIKVNGSQISNYGDQA